MTMMPSSQVAEFWPQMAMQHIAVNLSKRQSAKQAEIDTGNNARGKPS